MRFMKRTVYVRSTYYYVAIKHDPKSSNNITAISFSDTISHSVKSVSRGCTCASLSSAGKLNVVIYGSPDDQASIDKSVK